METGSNFFIRIIFQSYFSQKYLLDANPFRKILLLWTNGIDL